MKKGFTLIELLAVILILGIIALIAIPTVNNIISEARYGAFKSGNDNIMKTIEQTCQTSLIKGDNPVLSYLFDEGKSSHDIDVKGTLPNDGYIFLDTECNITDYYLTDNKNTYSNGEDVRNDYMLKELSENATSIFKTLYNDYFTNIISINFINNLNIPAEAIEIKDPSVSENGKIKSWLIPNGENYDLYVGSNKIIYANYNSAYLFNGFTNVINMNIYYLNTSFVYNMNRMFANMSKIKTIDFRNFITTNSKDTSSMFNSSSKLETLDLSNWDTRNIVDINRMFENCFKLKNINVSTWDTSKVVDMSWSFEQCSALEILDLSSWDTSNVTDMSYMFSSAVNIKYLNLSNFNTSNLTNIKGMFRVCTNLVSLDLSNWDLSKTNNVTDLFITSNNISAIKINNINTLSKIMNYLPDRTSLSTGIITFEADKSNIDMTILNSKNWNII